MRLTTVRCVACGRVAHTVDVRALVELEGWLRDGDCWACSRRCAFRAGRGPQREADATRALHAHEANLAALAARTGRNR